jgi:hypothetical protein
MVQENLLHWIELRQTCPRWNRRFFAWGWWFRWALLGNREKSPSEKLFREFWDHSFRNWSQFYETV